MGWRIDKDNLYKKWQQRQKAFYQLKRIEGKSGTSNKVWAKFCEHAIETENGLPGSGKALVARPIGDKKRDLARVRLHNLMLDCCKKDRDTETQEGMTAQRGPMQAAAEEEPE